MWRRLLGISVLALLTVGCAIEVRNTTELWACDARGCIDTGMRLLP